MDFYNQLAQSLKRHRSFVMVILCSGLGYVEYHLISYFMKIFNLYLRNNHAEKLTFVIALGIFVLIVLITIVFYQWAVALVLIFKETIRSKEETGFRWVLGNSLIIGTSFFFISALIMESVAIVVYFLFNKTLDIFWEIPFCLYAIALIFGLIIGINKEFTVLKYKEN